MLQVAIILHQIKLTNRFIWYLKYLTAKYSHGVTNGWCTLGINGMFCESDLSFSNAGFTYSRSHVSFEIINCTDERNRFYSPSRTEIFCDFFCLCLRTLWSFSLIILLNKNLWCQVVKRNPLLFLVTFDDIKGKRWICEKRKATIITFDI